VLGAFLEGWRRALGAPWLMAGVLAVTILTALPLAVVLQDEIAAHLGSSLEAGRARAGWNTLWAAEFSAQSATGLGRTFTHEILGFGGTLAALSDLLDAERLARPVEMAIAAYLLAWLFLSGGVIDRLARGRPVRPAAFFSACGGYFFRLLRLAAVVGPCYWALFTWLHPFLFVTLYDRWTRDTTSETDALLIRASLYAAFLAALMALSVTADFARVRTVVEDRRSIVSALGASLRFIRRRPVRVAGLYLLNIVAALVVLRLWLQAAPGASAPLWLALFGGHVYLVARVWARLAFLASEVAFFQGELAHAGYLAAPRPVWPDSAAVEGIRNLRG
jgi:hypothetical protein